MIDRNVEFPNRFQLQKVPGTDDIYDIIPAPGDVIAPGDLFSKGNMLPDEIVSLLGLKMENPQVKDALNVLANIGNVHVWERVHTYSDPVPEVPAGYTLGAVEENVVLASRKTTISTTGAFYYYYGDSVTVKNDGTVNAPSSDSWAEIGRDVSATTIKSGPLFVKGASSYISSGSGHQAVDVTNEATKVFYIPSGGTLSVTVDSNAKMCYVVATKYQPVIGYPYTPAIPAGTTKDYLTSTDRNAYPDNVTDAQDAYYTLGDAESGEFYLGQITSSVPMQYACSSAITVDSDGIVSLYNYQYYNIGAGFDVDSLGDAHIAYIGKYVRLISAPDYSSGWNILPIGEIVYIPKDATLSEVRDSYGNIIISVDKYQPVTGHAAIPANTTITYLGQLGGGARIEVGSYVGTGTYGKSNPNSLTFDFVPKVLMLLFVSAPVYGQNYAPTINSLFQGSEYNPVMVTSMLTNSPQPNVGFMYNSNGGTNTYDYAWISSDKRTIYWYNTRGSTQQFNGLAYQTIPNTYHYIAIG